MQPYLLRVVIALATVGVALVAIHFIERGGIDIEQYSGVAKVLRPLGLLLLTIFLVIYASRRPAVAPAEHVGPRFPTFVRASAAVRSFFRLSMVPRIAAVALLLAAPAFDSRDYFVLLRWVVAGAAAVTAVIATRAGRDAWSWLAAMVTILFNPLIEIHLSRETWTVIDPVVALWFVVSIFSVREKSGTGEQAAA